MPNVTHAPSNKLSHIMYEYGKACRCDYGDVDGRMILGAMETFASYVEAGNTQLNNDEAEALRINLGLCPNGCGHWDYECEECGHDFE